MIDYDDDRPEIDDDISEVQRRIENIAAEKIANKIFDKYNDSLVTHIDQVIFDIVKEDAKSYLNEEAKERISYEIENYMETRARTLIDKAIDDRIRKMLH